MPEKPKAAEGKSRLPVVFTVLFGLFMAWAARNGEVFGGFDRLWADTMFRIRGVRAGNPRVTIVGIDDLSLKRIGTYPWKRGTYVPVIENLNRYGAAGIAFDVMFVDASPLPDEDAALAKAIKEAGNVVLGVDVDHTKRPPQLRYPHPMFEPAGFGLYNVPFVDPDNSVRQVPLSYSPRINNAFNMKAAPERVPVLGLAALAMAEKRSFQSYEEELPMLLIVNIAGTEVKVIGERPKIDGGVEKLTEEIPAFRYISAFKLAQDQSTPQARRKLFESEMESSLDGEIQVLLEDALAQLSEDERMAIVNDEAKAAAFEEETRERFRREFQLVHSFYAAALERMEMTPEQAGTVAIPPTTEESEELQDLRRRYYAMVDQVMNDAIRAELIAIRRAAPGKEFDEKRAEFLAALRRLGIEAEAMEKAGADKPGAVFEIVRYGPFQPLIKGWLRELRAADKKAFDAAAAVVVKVEKAGWDLYTTVGTRVEEGETVEVDALTALDELEMPEALKEKFTAAVEVWENLSKIESEIVFAVVQARSQFVGTYRQLQERAAERVLLTEEEREGLKNGVVLIGYTATGGTDKYLSPFIAQSPGVEIHANMIDNILNGNFIQYLPPVDTKRSIVWPPIIASILLVGLGFLYVRLGMLPGAGATVATLIAVFAGDYYLFLAGYRFGAVSPALSLAGTFIVLTVHRAILEQNEKRWIRNTFAQYLSPKVIEAIQKNPELLELGGQRRDLTILFLDIAHFTNISEALTPEELTEFLNQFLTKLTDIILRHEGTIDKYIGDCVMAFWNAPLDVANHRTEACLASIECQAAMKELVANMTVKTVEEPKIRIGLNSGDASVGNFGSKQRFSYTIIGDEVNLSSRLEGANKYFGTRTMASEATYDEAKGKVVGRELGRIRVVGKSVPIRVFELVGKTGELEPQLQKKVDLYTEALAAFNKREFEKAKTGFEEVLKIDPEDKPAKLYLNQCNDYILIPPPDNWENVISLASK